MKTKTTTKKTGQETCETPLNFQTHEGSLRNPDERKRVEILFEEMMATNFSTL